MKRIRKYHIEYYWAQEAAKRQKRAEIRERLGEIILIVACFVLEGAVAFEFFRQLFALI